MHSCHGLGVAWGEWHSFQCYLPWRMSLTYYPFELLVCRVSKRSSISFLISCWEIQSLWNWKHRKTVSAMTSALDITSAEVSEVLLVGILFEVPLCWTIPSTFNAFTFLLVGLFDNSAVEDDTSHVQEVNWGGRINRFDPLFRHSKNVDDFFKCYPVDYQVTHPDT